MTGKREMTKSNGNETFKILAKSAACSAATTGAAIFGANLIGTGFMKVVTGIKEKRAGNIVAGIFAVGAGGIVFAGTHIIDSIVVDKIVDDLIEVEQPAVDEEEESLSSIDWSRLTMTGQKIYPVDPKTPVEE